METDSGPDCSYFLNCEAPFQYFCTMNFVLHNLHYDPWPLTYVRFCMYDLQLKKKRVPINKICPPQGAPYRIFYTIFGLVIGQVEQFEWSSLQKG